MLRSRSARMFLKWRDGAINYTSNASKSQELLHRAGAQLRFGKIFLCWKLWQHAAILVRKSRGNLLDLLYGGFNQDINPTHCCIRNPTPPPIVTLILSFLNEGFKRAWFCWRTATNTGISKELLMLRVLRKLSSYRIGIAYRHWSFESRQEVGSRRKMRRALNQLLHRHLTRAFIHLRKFLVQGRQGRKGGLYGGLRIWRRRAREVRGFRVVYVSTNLNPNHDFEVGESRQRARHADVCATYRHLASMAEVLERWRIAISRLTQALWRPINPSLTLYLEFHTVILNLKEEKQL